MTNFWLTGKVLYFHYRKGILIIPNQQLTSFNIIQHMVRGLILATSPILFIFRNFNTDLRKKRELCTSIDIWSSLTHTHEHTLRKDDQRQITLTQTHHKIKGSLKHS